MVSSTNYGLTEANKFLVYFECYFFIICAVKCFKHVLNFYKFLKLFYTFFFHFATKKMKCDRK